MILTATALLGTRAKIAQSVRTIYVTVGKNNLCYFNFSIKIEV